MQSGTFCFVLDEEVDQIYNIYKKITKNPKILRIELKEWYDGYRAAAGDYLYNPRSVVCALRDNQLANYWTSSGTYDSIFNYIKGNIADVRNDIVLMVAGRTCSRQKCSNMQQQQMIYIQKTRFIQQWSFMDY